MTRPRGEVGIVVAGLGLSTGAIDSEIYSVAVGMAILTTLIVPPLLPRLVRRAEGVAALLGDDGPAAGIEDDDGVIGEPAAEAHDRTAGTREREDAEHMAEPEPSVDDEDRDRGRGRG